MSVSTEKLHTHHGGRGDHCLAVHHKAVTGGTAGCRRTLSHVALLHVEADSTRRTVGVPGTARPPSSSRRISPARCRHRARSVAAMPAGCATQFRSQWPSAVRALARTAGALSAQRASRTATTAAPVGTSSCCMVALVGAGEAVDIA